MANEFKLSYTGLEINEKLKQVETNTSNIDALSESMNNIGGTIEVTSGEPTKENTVVTISPSSEITNIYTTEEVDAKFEQMSEEIADQQKEIDSKAPAILSSTDEKYSFSIDESQNAKYQADVSEVNAVYVSKTEDIFPITDQQTASLFQKNEDNSILVNGTFNSSSTFYARVNGNSVLSPKKEIKTGDSVTVAFVKSSDITGGTVPIKLSLFFVYEDGESVENTFNPDEKKGVQFKQFTAQKDVKSIRLALTFRSGYTFDNVTLNWFVVVNNDFNEIDVTELNTFTIEDIGNNGLTVIPVKGVCKKVVDTKEYIDNHLPENTLTYNDLVYVTPKMFGAKGNGVDDSNALQNCINYAIENNVCVRGYGSYTIATPLKIRGSIKLYLNRIIYTGNDYAVNYSGKRSIIRIDGITASNGSGFLLTTDEESKDGTYNDITLPFLYVKNACLSHEPLENYPGCSYNTYHLKYLNSADSDCITIKNSYGQNTFYGNQGQVNATNGHAINVKSGDNHFYDFSIEKNVKHGIVQSNCKNYYYNFRTVEFCDEITSNDKYFIKFIGWCCGTKFTNMYADYVSIDTSECRSYEEVFDEACAIWSQGEHLLDSDFYRYWGYFKPSEMLKMDRLGVYKYTDIRMNTSDFHKHYDVKLIVWFNKKIICFEPYDLYREITDGTYDLRNLNNSPVTFFDVKTNTNIILNDWYCAIGTKQIIVTQTDSNKATIYDKNYNDNVADNSDHIIFDGNLYDSGTYKLTAIANLLKHDGISDDDTFDGYKSFYDGTEKWIIEKVTVA